MTATLLEQTRVFHEDIERLEKAAVDCLLENAKTHRDLVFQTHFVNKCLEKIIDRSKQLELIYGDSDGLRKEEINSISGQGLGLYSLYYDRLKELKEYHRKFPNLMPERPEDILPNQEELNINFTGEEGSGKFLDLHEFYIGFINLQMNLNVKKCKDLDYLNYLQIFYQFDNRGQPEDTEYSNYLRSLLEYLIDFIRRSHPLFHLDKVIAEIEDDFHNKWELGVQQWPESESNGSGLKSEREKKKKNKKGSKSSELVQIPKLKQLTDPLYCTYCQKKFSKETVFQAHLKGKKHLRASSKQKLENHLDQTNGDMDIKEDPKHAARKYLFFFEVKINRLGELLSETIDATKENIEKKQARTFAEIAAELEHEEEVELESEDEEEEEQFVGIQNYPVGWDGKPIPYWLYKLHGLGIEYKCEICGNTSYWGRRAFERHFQEWRHAHGMRCLQIPNTRHFHEITKIADAIELYKKIKQDQWKAAWKADVEEEFEDQEGNVFPKKTYLDLQRQGLI